MAFLIYNLHSNVYMPHACLRALTALWIFVMGPSLFSVNDSNISCVKSRRARPSISCENKAKMREINLVWNKSCTEVAYYSLVETALSNSMNVDRHRNTMGTLMARAKFLLLHLSIGSVIKEFLHAFSCVS